MWKVELLGIVKTEKENKPVHVTHYALCIMNYELCIMHYKSCLPISEMALGEESVLVCSFRERAVSIPLAA